MRRKFAGGYLLAQEGKPQGQNPENLNLASKKVREIYWIGMQNYIIILTTRWRPNREDIFIWELNNFIIFV